MAPCLQEVMKFIILVCVMNAAVLLYHIFVVRPARQSRYLDLQNHAVAEPGKHAKHYAAPTPGPWSPANIKKLMVSLWTRTRGSETNYELTKPLVCSRKGSGTKLVIIVQSAPSHERARLTIRRTWGRYATRTDVSLFFLIGKARTWKMTKQIRVEHEKYEDILFAHFIDTYNNLTLKSITMLGWVKSCCPKADFLLKSDDDMFINVPRLLQYISTLKRWKRAIYGRITTHAAPSRLKRAKHYLTYKEFKLHVYPDYAVGHAYLMPARLATDFYYAALYHQILKWEDVFITGIVATNINIPRINYDAFQDRRRWNRCFIQKSICVHGVYEEKQFDYLNEVFHGDQDCRNYEL